MFVDTARRAAENPAESGQRSNSCAGSVRSRVPKGLASFAPGIDREGISDLLSRSTPSAEYQSYQGATNDWTFPTPREGQWPSRSSCTEWPHRFLDRDAGLVDAAATFSPVPPYVFARIGPIAVLVAI